MTTLIALMLMSGSEAATPPKYKVGECYEKITEIGHTLIRIEGVKLDSYDYRYFTGDHWSMLLSNGSGTIEEWYDIRVNCNCDGGTCRYKKGDHHDGSI